MRTNIEKVLLRQGGVIARRQHPELTSALDWMLRRGAVVAVLPGVYAPPDVAAGFATRVRAMALSDPDAVFIGASAARLTFWPQIPGGLVEVAVSRQKAAARGYSVSRRKIAPELVLQRGRLRVSTPALTALDLCGVVGGDGIDVALRSRATTLDALHEALRLTPCRDGNHLRRELLLDSRDEPWSAAERLTHRLFRAAGLSGWVANLAVRTDAGTYFIDVAFERQRLAIEIDGRLHEDDPDVFERDRWRQNTLVLEGWRVLRFTWRMLKQDPDLVLRTVEAALAP